MLRLAVGLHLWNEKNRQVDMSLPQMFSLEAADATMCINDVLINL